MQLHTGEPIVANMYVIWFVVGSCRIDEPTLQVSSYFDVVFWN